MTLLFWICALGGAALLLIGILADGVLDWLPLDDAEVVPTLGAFVGAFGIAGLVVSSLTDDAPVPSLIGATIGGLAVGWLAFRLVRSVLGMATDPTPMSSDLRGRSGKVVTPIGADAAGEVLVRLAGQPHKLLARADRYLPVGTTVVVVEVLSASAVRVEPESSFFGGELEEEIP